MTLREILDRSALLEREHANAIDLRDWQRAADIKARMLDLDMERSALAKGRVLDGLP